SLILYLQRNYDFTQRHGGHRGSFFIVIKISVVFVTLCETRIAGRSTDKNRKAGAKNANKGRFQQAPGLPGNSPSRQIQYLISEYHTRNPPFEKQAGRGNLGILGEYAAKSARYLTCLDCSETPK
ncbi:MAG: hypothetical protein FWD31_08655, partial [Planctomycetaceae bacterium]|nr:hypothetical protein [Planctomycetaceae bacterium]